MSYIDYFLQLPVELQIVEASLLALAVFMGLRATIVALRKLREVSQKGESGGE